MNFSSTDEIIVLNNYAGYYYHTNDETSHSKIPSTENMDSMLSAYEITRDMIKQNNRTEFLKEFFSNDAYYFYQCYLNIMEIKRIFEKIL